MIFYKLKIDGLFQFEDFELDLTYSRESKYSPIVQSHKKYPLLKYKKFLLILGANASGKTSLGRTMCILQNFILGRDLWTTRLIDLNKIFSLEDSLEKVVSLTTVFSSDNFMYELDLKFNHQGIFHEEWKRVKLTNLSYNKLELKLKQEVPFFIKDEESNEYFSSMLRSDKYNDITNDIKLSTIYNYSFSGEQIDIINEHIGFNDRIFEKILISFDPSISKVSRSDEIPDNRIIEFKNGHKEIILKDGSLANKENSILSTGTKESLFLIFLMTGIHNEVFNTIYIDEKMTNSHSKIEQQMIQIFITIIDNIDGQVFITSHNSDILNLNIPNYNFVLLKKNTDRSITEAIQLEKFQKHNNRLWRKIVEDDVFSTAPVLDSLIDLQETLLESNQKSKQ